MADINLKCKDCGADFVFTEGEQAFYAEKEQLPIDQCVGRISAESVMCYPPGIPILSPGEVISEEILDYIKTAMVKGCSMQGPESEDISELFVLK